MNAAYATDNGAGVFKIGNDFIERTFTYNSGAKTYLNTSFKNKISGQEYIYQSNYFDNYKLVISTTAAITVLNTLVGSSALHDSATAIITSIPGGIQLQVTIPVSNATYQFSEIWTYTCLTNEPLITTTLKVISNRVDDIRFKLINFERQNIAMPDSANTKLRTIIFDGSEDVLDSGSDGSENKGCQLIHDPTNSEGIFTASYEVEAQSNITTNQAGNFRQWQVLLDNVYVLLSAGGNVTLYPHITGVYQGDQNYGRYQYQIYVNNHIRTSAEQYPFGYYSWNDLQLNQTTVNHNARIPVVGSGGLGVDMYFIDDGWHTGYGDWIINTVKIPDLHALINSIKAAGMQAGLWFCIEILKTSAAATTYANSRLLDSGSNPIANGNNWKMCTGSFVYIDYLGNLLGSIFQTYGITYTRIDFPDNFIDCYATNHDHQGHAVDASVVNDGRRMQQEGFRRLANLLRTYVPNLIIQWQADNKSLLDVFDTNWTSDWNNSPYPDHTENYFNTATFNRNVFYKAISKDSPAYIHQGWFEAHDNGQPNQGPTGQKFFLISSMGLCPSTGITGQVLSMTSDEKDLFAKWLKWNKANRKYIKFSNNLPLANVPDYTGMTNLDAWSSLSGNGGYIFIFNPSGVDVSQTISGFSPKKYAPNISSFFQIIDQDTKQVVFSGKNTKSQNISFTVTVPAQSVKYYKIQSKRNSLIPQRFANKSAISRLMH